MKFKNLILGMFMAASVAATASDARYVFYFIGDGMGMGPVLTAETYNREILKNDKPLLMMQFPVVGWCTTYSASSMITDSAAAGTALSTGTKTKNSMLGMGPDTTSVTSIARFFKDDGFGVGIVTSVAPDDATPGAFYAHVPNRKDFYTIGRQAAESGYEFIAGAGLRGVTDKKGNPTDLLDVMKANDVRVVYGPEELKTVGTERVMLVNNHGTPDYNIGYTIDSVAGGLTLPMMTEACLDRLMKTSPDRFFMMVEGGNIDHALHANDGGTVIVEIFNFNEALKVAFDFYLAHPDETLIVVTADHDTGGMVLCHPKGKKYVSHVEYFKKQRMSKEAFSEYCKSLIKSDRDYTWADMKAFLEKNTGLFSLIPVDDDDETSLRESFEESFEQHRDSDQKTLYASFNAFAAKVYKLINDAAGIKYTTLSHSGNPVPVFAVGAGSDLFKSYNDNSNLPRLILEAAGKDPNLLNRK